jgi:hypothetical protein
MATVDNTMGYAVPGNTDINTIPHSLARGGTGDFLTWLAIVSDPSRRANSPWRILPIPSNRLSNIC